MDSLEHKVRGSSSVIVRKDGDGGITLSTSATTLLQGQITPPALSTNVNDYNPTGLSTASLIRLSTTGTVYDTFDPNKGGPPVFGDITLSNGNLTAAGSGTWDSIMSVTGKTTGKWKVELTSISLGSNVMLGIAGNAAGFADANWADYLGDNAPAPNMTYSTGYWGSGDVYFNLAAAGFDAVATYTTGDHIDFLLDLDSGTQTVTFRKNGTNIKTKNLPAGQTWYFGASLQNTGIVTINAGASAFTYTDTGYSGWTVAGGNNFSITGLAGGTVGRVMAYLNLGPGNITLKDNSSSSAAANRYYLTADLVLAPKATALTLYDGTLLNWLSI